MKYGIDTRCQHLADDNKDEIYGAISYPIYSLQHLQETEQAEEVVMTIPDYRIPTREHPEKIVASLEEGIEHWHFRQEWQQSQL